MNLIEDVKGVLQSSPQVADLLGLEEFKDFPELAGTLFAQLCNNAAIGATVQSVYKADAVLVETTLYDITETARRNFEPGGGATTLLFSRGVHAIMAHRVAHKIWCAGDHTLALAIKSSCGRVFSTDIHPAAQIGAGLWLDHGLGFVAGETAVIGEDASIWHNVTLGSTLSDSGAQRHPNIGAGAVIGAGAMVLGGITVGRNANIAAGAIVVEDVPDGMRVVGAKAQLRGAASIRFAKEEG